MVRASFGNTAATSVDDVKPDHLPLVLIVCKQKGGYNVYNILHGTPLKWGWEGGLVEKGGYNRVAGRVGGEGGDGRVQ